MMILMIDDDILYITQQNLGESAVKHRKQRYFFFCRVKKNYWHDGNNTNNEKASFENLVF